MKVLCISKWAKAPSPEERDAILPKEVPATLKLYLDGVIEQMWFKLDAPGVVFLVNAESVDAAKTHVHGLPMGQAGLMDFDFIPRRHAPAISVSTNPGLVDKLSVPLSTRTVISRLSTDWIIADAPHEVISAAPARLTFRRSACRAEPAARRG